MADQKLSSPQLSDSKAAMDQPQIKQEQDLPFHTDKNPDKLSPPQLSDSQAAMDQPQTEQEQALDFHPDKNPDKLFSPQVSDSQAAIDQASIEQEQDLPFHPDKNPDKNPDKLSSQQLSDSQAATDQAPVEQEQDLPFHPDKHPDKLSSQQQSDSQAAIDQHPIEQEQAISFHTYKDHLHLFLQETLAIANHKQEPAESQKKTHFNSLLDALEDAKLRLGGGSAENNPTAASGVHARGVFPFSILARGGGDKRARASKAFWRAVDEEEEEAVNSGNDNLNEGCELCPQCGWEVKYQVGRDGRVTLSIMDEENENIFKGRGRVQALKANPANDECQGDEEGGGVSLFKGQDSDDGGVCLSEARDIECGEVKLYQHADTQAPLPVTRKGKDAGGYQDSSESAQGTDSDHEDGDQDNSGPAQETGCNNGSKHKNQMNLPQQHSNINLPTAAGPLVLDAERIKSSKSRKKLRVRFLE